MMFRAALVHLLTACGLIPMMLAVDAIWHGDARLALLWMAAAMAIDGLDGPLARRFAVAEHMPQIDGAILDHVIDFTGYCFLPALMIYRFDLVAPDMVIFATSFLLMSSLYTFANTQAKTDEYDFRGFPALWNVVVLHMILFETGQTANLLIILFLGAMTFAPVRFIHPVRVVAIRKLTLVMLALWTAMTFALLLMEDAPGDWLRLYLVCGLYFIALSGWRSWALRDKKAR